MSQNTDNQNKDISTNVELLSIAATLAKVKMNAKQCEFMFRVAELIIEKGDKTSLGEIKEIQQQVDDDIKERKLLEKQKKALEDNKDIVYGGNKPTLIEERIDGVQERLSKQRN